MEQCVFNRKLHQELINWLEECGVMRLDLLYSV